MSTREAEQKFVEQWERLNDFAQQHTGSAHNHSGRTNNDKLDKVDATVATEAIVVGQRRKPRADEVYLEQQEIVKEIYLKRVTAKGVCRHCQALAGVEESRIVPEDLKQHKHLRNAAHEGKTPIDGDNHGQASQLDHGGGDIFVVEQRPEAHLVSPKGHTGHKIHEVCANKVCRRKSNPRDAIV